MRERYVTRCARGYCQRMKRWRAESDGSAAEAWDRLARPARWQEWAPHVRGAWGLGELVREGDAGAARLLGVVPVPVRITAVDAPRSWSWRVGELVEMEHRVTARPGGFAVTLELRAPAPLEAGLALAYGPLVALALRRLASSC
jgi:hypothetical protein